MLSLIKKICSLPSRNDQKLLLTLLPLMGLVSILELAGLGLLISLVSVLLGASPPTAEPIKFAYNFIQQFDIVNVAIFAVIFIILKNLSLLGLNYLIARLTFNALSRFLINLYSYYLSQPYKQHLQRNSSEFINHLSKSAPTGFDALRLLTETTLELLLFILTLGVLILSQSPFILIAGILLILIALIYHKAISPVFRRWGAEGYSHEVNALTLIKETFGAIKEILVYKYQNHFVRRFRTLVFLQSRLQSLSTLNLSSTRLVIESIFVAGIGIFVVWANNSDNSAAENASILSIVGLAMMRLLPSANRILSNFSELSRRSKIIELLYDEMIAANLWQSKMDTSIVIRSNSENPNIAVEFAGVSYTYPTVDTPSIRDLNLVIQHGDIVGFAGSSGAGKSTTIEIILGLITPQVGDVTVGGAYITETNLPKKLSFVPQTVTIIDDTVLHNVAFGIEDDDIDHEAVWEAIEKARLTEVIKSMDDGLKTSLGEKGVRLSGGQRQRIGIARALYLDPSILILDEATSAVDNETEAQITEAINAFRHNKTIIIIAHRLSTLRDCDYILYFEAGKIAGKGSFEELIKTQPSFKQLVELGKL